LDLDRIIIWVLKIQILIYLIEFGLNYFLNFKNK